MANEKVAIEPQLQDRSILAADRITEETRRVETDGAGNVYVNVAAGTLTPVGTQDVNIVGSTIIVPVVISSVVGSAVSRIPSLLTSQVLVAANILRKGLLLYNHSTAFQYIKFGAVAGLTDFTVRLTPNMYYEVENPIYNGRIDVISSSTNGAIQVTELS